MPSVDEIVAQAYRAIDDQSDYKIPKLEKFKKSNNINKRVTACKDCGTALTYNFSDKVPVRCTDCKKRISDLYRKRKNKSFCKNSIIPLS